MFQDEKERILNMKQNNIRIENYNSLKYYKERFIGSDK